MQPLPPTPAPGVAEPTTIRKMAVRYLLIFVVLGFTLFWIWALFFASKEGVNTIGDAEWTERADTICLAATEQRLELADLRVIEEVGPDAIYERAIILDKSTDILSAMLDDVVAIEPNSEKGKLIVPLWEADYRIYLQDRYSYTDQLRESGENLPFYETKIGIPISEKIETFAFDNTMGACAPPHDLTV